MSYLVRIKKRDPRHGHVLRQYVYKGISFKEGAGWYRVSAEVAERLREVRQLSNDPRSPLAFDVCSEKEAAAADDKEEKESQTRRPAQDAKQVLANDEAPKPRKRRGRRKKAAEDGAEDPGESTGASDDSTEKDGES